MSFGFQAVNSNGYVQIDGDYANYEVTQSGAIDARVAAGMNHYVGASDRSNLVFVRPRNNGVKFAQWGPYAGGTAPIGIWPAGIYFVVNLFGLGMVDYFTAARSSAFLGSTDDSQFGLQVTNESGQVSYDSRRRYVRIAGVVYATLGSNYPGLTHTVDLPPPSPGKKYYVALNGLWITLWSRYDYGGGSVDYDQYGYTAQFTSDTRLVIRTMDWVSGDNPGIAPATVIRRLDATHTPAILIAEF